MALIFLITENIIKVLWKRKINFLPTYNLLFNINITNNNKTNKWAIIYGGLLGSLL